MPAYVVTHPDLAQEHWVLEAAQRDESELLKKEIEPQRKEDSIFGQTLCF